MSERGENEEDNEHIEMYTQTNTDASGLNKQGNLQINLDVKVGKKSSGATFFDFKLVNSETKMKALKKEIKDITGLNPKLEDIWAFSKLNGPQEFLNTVEEIGLSKKWLKTFPQDDGCWARFEVMEALKDAFNEQGVSFSQIPFLKNFKGDSSIEFSMSSGVTFDQAIQRQLVDNYFSIICFFSCFNLKFNVNMEDNTFNSVWEVFTDIMRIRSDESFALYAKTFIEQFQSANLSFSFASWEDLPHLIKRLNEPKLLRLVESDFAYLVAGIGEILENATRFIIILTDTIYIEIAARTPGLVSWALNQLEN